MGKKSGCLSTIGRLICFTAKQMQSKLHITMPEIAIKRVYEESSPYDGYRVLVDRLWPRGISKEAAQIDEWNKDLAPSTDLRKWFGHDPARWDEFSAKYMQELKANGFGNEFLQRLGKEEKITLVYAAKDPKHCHPLVLHEYLISL